MIILGIETSCDETGVSIIKAAGGRARPQFTVLAHLVASQVKVHEPWGGVVPNLAKREHQKNLIPLLKQALEESKLLETEPAGKKVENKIKKTLAREPELLEQFLAFIPHLKKPKINLIAVTQGPGLEPALWVGLNFAKALRAVWQIPVTPINHMEGHLVSPVEAKVKFPILGLLVSGGHTELVLAKAWGQYKLLGQTRDDAAGEAFDKVARLLGLPYPGGPALAQLATAGTPGQFDLPRPMINSPDYDFSFSGLKTAVVYLVKKLGTLDEQQKQNIAVEFEQAVIDVLLAKTKRAIEEYAPATLIAAGGVLANTHLVAALQTMIKKYPTTQLLIPPHHLSTDNATMIAMAGYLSAKKKSRPATLTAQGRLTL